MRGRMLRRLWHAILRDRDANAARHEQADSTREERRYYCQNWRADVVALLTDTGKMVEWVKYSSYGVPFALPAGDTDSDGDWDATDSGNITGGGGYDVRKDTELDGDVDTADITHANSITGSYQTLGRGILSSRAVNNRRSYAGYEYDPTFEGAGRHLYDVRHRVYDADVGRWTRRDPLGYVDGMSLYAYVQGLAVVAADPWGLFICVGGCSPPTPGPISNPGGGGGGPPVCAGGTCSVPIAPGPSGPGGPGPIICAGGACSVPIVTDPDSPGGLDPFVCVGGACSVPPACPSGGGGGGSGGGGGGGNPGGGGGSGGGGGGGSSGGGGSGGSSGGGSGGSPGAGQSWSQCFSNCMDDYYGGAGWATCLGSFGIDFAFGKTPKTEHEKKMEHRGRGHTTRFRRWQATHSNKVVRHGLRRAAKVLYTGTVGKVVAAASCGYALGVSASCAGLCAADQDSF